MVTPKTILKFSEEEKALIQKAVQDLEAHTSGEMVPYFVKRSDDYPEASWYLAAGFGAVASVCFAGLSYFWLIPHTFTVFNVCIGIFLTIVAGFLLPYLIPGLRYYLVGSEKCYKRVMEKAETAFLEEEIFNTRDRTGVLLYISRLEHQVIVMGDSGINAKVQPEDWQHVVELVVKGIKEKRRAEGIAEAIHAIKDLLVKHGFERREDDENELGDHLRER